jgi:hypothetical protein
MTTFAPEVSCTDTDGLMVPPWVKFPNLPKQSMAWWVARDQACEGYRDVFLLWWGRQVPQKRQIVRERYPEPPEWTDFYLIGCLATPGMDPRVRRIWELIGALYEALWHRGGEPGFSMWDHLSRNAADYRPESEEEIAIWNELTEPRNHLALVQHAEYSKQEPVNDYMAQISALLLDRATRRSETDCGQG